MLARKHRKSIRMEKNKKHGYSNYLSPKTRKWAKRTFWKNARKNNDVVNYKDKYSIGNIEWAIY